MADSKLSPLQWRLIRVLGAIEPPWVLTGGAALAGFHTLHRTTKDLDLFWRGTLGLGDIPARVLALLGTAGLDATTLQHSPAFHRILVTGPEGSCVVDLVADPVNAIEPPLRVKSGDSDILLDSAHEILVNKLTALLSRSEARDLEDVRVLLEAGGDLPRALRDAPGKDGGFSALTLAWVLSRFAAGKMARSLGWSGIQAAELDTFRERLIEDLLALGRP